MLISNRSFLHVEEYVKRLAQKMLVMQSTFFGLPQEAAIIQDALHEQPSRKALIPPTAISRKHSRDSDGEGLRGDSRQVCGVVNFFGLDSSIM